MTVTRAITEEIKRGRSLEKEGDGGTSGGREVLVGEQQVDEKDRLEPACGSDRFEGRNEPVGSQSVGEWDSGSGTDLTGKLCQHVMALIRWRVGADKAVMEHVVQALEEWLQRRGISIYTDWL
jgi:hypothetical protein